jgi:deoxyribose-phosphate aldolase
VAQEADIEALAAQIAEAVRVRLAAARVGVEEGCSAAVGPTEMRDGCTGCPTEDACAPRALALAGATRLGQQVGEVRSSRELAPLIDHTLLKPDATYEELRKLCDEAKRYQFATVCVNSANVSTAARMLAGSEVKPIAVVGFPLGAAVTSAKVFETREAVRCGAAEIDMVINIGALKSRDYKSVMDDIAAVVKAAGRAPVKVIIETAQLDQNQKIIACALAKSAGAAFVKTSTGFGGGGATVEDIALMRAVVGEDVGVKASGGVRTAEDAMKLVKAGANRIGASASVAIVSGQKPAVGKY